MSRIGVVRMLVVLALLAASAQGVSASPPHPAAPRANPGIDASPRVMDLAAAQAANPSSQTLQPFGATIPRYAINTNLQREVFGFVNAYNLGDPYVGYPSWRLDLLSTVAYFGLVVNSGDGHFVPSGTGWNVFHSSTMTNFVNAAHARGVRVLVSINLHDLSTDPNGAMCNGLAPASVQNTVNDTVVEVNYANLDGVNVNYEGQITTCANGHTNRDELTAFVQNLRAALGTSRYLAVDTYGGSAEDNLEFFDVTGLAPNVDVEFVMAYDMDNSNYGDPPLTCGSYCFSPVSPLNTYRFNVTKSITQYTALISPNKVVIGQPYYGRASCVTLLSDAHQYPISSVISPTYYNAAAVRSSGALALAQRRDPSDGVSEWDTWRDTGRNCNMEQYWDDPYSLAAKYAAINQYGLRGVGLFSLDYAGGAPELWSLLATYFVCPATPSVQASQSTTEFSVSLSAGYCPVALFDVQQYDSTLNQGWFDMGPSPASGGAGSFRAEGFAGHSYMFRARALSNSGGLSAWSAPVTTQVSTTATPSHPFAGLMTLDAYGGLNSADSPPLSTSDYWPGWGIARAAKALPGASSPQSGFVLDGWGGLHTYGSPAVSESWGASGHYWSGWDIARDFAFLPNGSGGVVLDGWGGLHPFGVSPNTTQFTVQMTAYWPNWDIARKVVIFPDGTGGYVLDGWGGLHPFGINGPAPVLESKIKLTGYWPGWSIARDVVVVPGNGGGHSGYVLDGWGGLHPFYVTSDVGAAMPAGINTSGYWPWWDIARGVWLLPGSSTAGYTLDGWGGLHPFGGAPAIMSASYWPYQDIAKGVWGA